MENNVACSGLVSSVTYHEVSSSHKKETRESKEEEKNDFTFHVKID
jgi:hypothetical protein